MHPQHLSLLVFITHLSSQLTYWIISELMYCATIALGGYSSHSGKFHYIQDVDLGLYMQHYLQRTLEINTPGLVTPSIHFTSGQFCFRPSRATCGSHVQLIHSSPHLSHLHIKGVAQSCSSYHL